jgi:hypothetical protein
MGFPKIKMNGKGIYGIRIMISPFKGRRRFRGREESTSGGIPWNG